ncbi:MAG: NAD(P)/FAD-dependent oxidoreductase [Kineosporiaceae bacterium]|nr:NAD(P)/FAD-dependent oxidoreductase [Kineosporiaceae bacterium]
MSPRANHPTPTGQTGHALNRHRVVIIGSGFGGLFAARALARADADVVLIARTTHHLFQPLLYQVATGILSEGEVAPSTREVLAGQANATVLLGEVRRIDLAARTVTSHLDGHDTVTAYDSLIVAAGTGQSYFGNDHFAEFAPGMKSIDDALELRGRIFGAFERAELATDPAEIRRLLTFVVVGAGPTGVEMAGQIAELSRRTLRHDFRRIDPTAARVILLDAVEEVLPTFGDQLGTKARRRLERIGVELQLGATVVGMDARGVEIRDGDGTRRRIETACPIWAAGVSASPLGRMLAEQSGAELDRAGRVAVGQDLTLPGHPEVFVVGDLIASAVYDPPLPGVAQVAIQSGRHAARTIRARLAAQVEPGPFRYRDKGSMATISRFSAVASVGPVRLSGVFGWVLWLGVHLVYLIGFKNRVTTLLHWMVSFLGRGRAERTVTDQQVRARNVLRHHHHDHPDPLRAAAPPGL